VSFGFYTCQFTFQDKEWKEVIYLHNEKTLEAKVCGASMSKWSYGPIAATHCSVQIGYGNGLTSYVGLIDDVSFEIICFLNTPAPYPSRYLEVNNTGPEVIKLEFELCAQNSILCFFAYKNKKHLLLIICFGTTLLCI
jgi:hypothetical protein